MILLLGGTAETALLATKLAEAGYRVLVSTATAIILETGTHHLIRRRTGALNEGGLAELIGREGIRAIVDATHPYAEAVRRNARKTAESSRIPYYTYIRPPAIIRDDGFIFARDHSEAATRAFSFGRPVFLTTGSRNLAPYAAAARQTGGNLVVRILDTPDSLRTCHDVGIQSKNIIRGRGPFTCEHNAEIIRKFGIGVMVTKDGGSPGGVDAKIEAARQEGCALVVVARPEAEGKNSFTNMDDLLLAFVMQVSP